MGENDFRGNAMCTQNFADVGSVTGGAEKADLVRPFGDAWLGLETEGRYYTSYGSAVPAFIEIGRKFSAFLPFAMAVGKDAYFRTLESRDPST